MWALDTKVFRKGQCYMRIGLLSAVGFLWGASWAYSVNNKKLTKYSEVAQENFDKEIMGAFEKKYVERSLNAAGYGNNALNMGSHTTGINPSYKKPY